MARLFRLGRLGLSIALVGLGAAALGPPAGASAPPPGPGVGTGLPPGWELCILEGIGAPATQDNVANLDEWQDAEGGSTNNSAAYDPFNTRRMTDSNNGPLPAVISSNGFPAFATWAAGCAATVATLLQPNMAPIVEALKAGDVSTPGAFLLDVDRSQWCAPSPNGIPCYASQILSGDSTLADAQLAPGSGQLEDALTIFSTTTADIRAFDQDVTVIAADQSLLAEQTQQLALADDELSVARWKLSAAERALRKLALYDYMNSGALNSDANLHLFEPATEKGVIAQVYGEVATSAMVDHNHRAEAAVKTLDSHRLAVATAVAHATSVLDSDEVAGSQALSRLDGDVSTVEAGGACTGISPVAASESSLGSQESASQTWVVALQVCLAALAPSAPATTN